MQINKTVLLICLLLIYVSQNVVSSESIPNRKIVFSSDRGSIQFYIEEMSKKYGIAFSYEPDKIPLKKEIVLTSREFSISEAFDEIFNKNGIEYIVNSNVVILRKTNERNSDNKNRYTVSGIVKDAKSSETLAGAVVYLIEAKAGDLANEYGFYSVTAPEGHYTINITNIGYESLVIDTLITNNLRLDIVLSPSTVELEEVIINKKDNKLKDFQQGISRIEMKSLKELPSLAGEADVMRNITMLPGVNCMSDVGGDFQVRGGAWDQNLMMLDEAPVYNSNHMYGIYSTFNTDIIKDIKFYKSLIPASYGGRVSSVMDITQKEGNMQSYHLNGSLGVIMGKLSVEGPIIKEKASFIISGRRSLYEIYLPYTNNENAEDTRPYFYDLNAKINFVINQNNRIYFSNYTGQDLIDQNINESYANTIKFGNNTSTLRFNHLFSSRLFSNTSLIYSQYNMSIAQTLQDTLHYDAKLGLKHYELKTDFTYTLERQKINFGVRGVYYTFQPGKQQPHFIDSLNYFKRKVPDQFAFEGSIYIDDVIKINDKFELQAGLRLSNYSFLGKYSVKKYAPNEPKIEANIIDTLFYGKNEVVKSYVDLDPRISIKFNISGNQTAVLSYSKVAQYVQLVSRTFSPLPYDMWQPSNTYLKPLRAHQFSAGWFYQWTDKFIDFSVETYYKKLDNVLEVKPGAEIILNDKMDGDLLQGKGEAYGIEFGLSKTSGRISGMLSYTYSKTRRKVDSKLPEERINVGSWFATDYDIPNKINFAFIYKLNNRINLTSDFVYQTGRPLSLPSGQFVYFNRVMPFYAGKNLSRYADYHRLDVGAVIHNRVKPNRKWQSTWTISVFNVYGRRNPYAISIRPKENTQDTQIAELWFFYTVPSLTYSFKF